MGTIEHIAPLEVKPSFPWFQYFLDTFLALVGALLITGIIDTFNLYPRIPNISIVYLLVVITLAATRGLYAALLTAIVASLSFDFFIVPPIYTFTMYRVEEWIALFVFLVDAFLTGQLASALRRRVKEAARREHETRILYDLVRLATHEEAPTQQLQIIAQAIIDVFASWGVCDCTILQPDVKGILRVQASAPQPVEQVVFSADEQAIAKWVMTYGRSMGMYDDASLSRVASTRVIHRVLTHTTAARRAMHRYFCLIPLKMGQHVVGVLRLQVLDHTLVREREEYLEENQDQPNVRTTFFWTFLDQAASLIERTRLRSENQRIELLQRTDALRAALLSSVSHDLRTPLTVIKATASSLLQRDIQWDEETQISFARSIVYEADRLDRLVANLLDMSRIEGGAIKPEKEWYQISILIQDILHRLQPLLQDRLVHVCLPRDLPPIELDTLQIDQVLTNLIENAVRYTPVESLIEIDAQCHEDQVIIRVADRGPGIPRDDLERIFDKFYRVMRDTSSISAGSTPAGCGLGLAVCRGLIEAHGGRIWAELREGGGVIFFISLPVGICEEI